MRYIFFVCVWVLSGLLLTNQPSQAQSGADGTTFHKIIKNQMNAFASGDAAGAFSFANSDLQKRYQTPDVLRFACCVLIAGI